LFFNAIDAGDVLVAQPGNRLCFSLEAFKAHRVLGQLLRQGFDGDIAFEPSIAGEVHHTHPATTDLTLSLYGPI
jgi:hypothetical protein